MSTNMRTFEIILGILTGVIFVIKGRLNGPLCDRFPTFSGFLFGIGVLMILFSVGYLRWF